MTAISLLIRENGGKNRKWYKGGNWIEIKVHPRKSTNLVTLAKRDSGYLYLSIYLSICHLLCMSVFYLSRFLLDFTDFKL